MLILGRLDSEVGYVAAVLNVGCCVRLFESILWSRGVSIGLMRFWDDDERGWLLDL